MAILNDLPPEILHDIVLELVAEYIDTAITAPPDDLDVVTDDSKLSEWFTDSEEEEEYDDDDDSFDELYQSDSGYNSEESLHVISETDQGSEEEDVEVKERIDPVNTDPNHLLSRWVTLQGSTPRNYAYITKWVVWDLVERKSRLPENTISTLLQSCHQIREETLYILCTALGTQRTPQGRLVYITVYDAQHSNPPAWTKTHGVSSYSFDDGTVSPT